ncbi:MAG: protoporphyrinogen oxidase [Gemmatimonadota bacterium]
MIGIVGGGISGLFLLHLLTKQGVEALLFEADGEPGGVIRSRRLTGPSGEVTADLGPQRVRLTPGLGTIVDDLGLRPSLLRAPTGVPFTVYYRGHLHPAPLGVRDALRSSLISWGGKLRALGDLVTGPPAPEESVAHALRRKLGPEIFERLAGPILGGLYGSHPEEMEARHTLLPILRRTGGGRSLLLALLRASRAADLPVVSFEEGMGALPWALAERYRDRVRPATPVREIRSAGGGFHEIATDGDTIRVRDVVLAVPAPEAGRILATAAPEAASLVGSLRYNPLAVVPLVASDPDRLPPVGTGFKMTLDSPMATRGVTAHGTLFGRTGLFSAFLGGMGGEALMDRPDAEILAIAQEEFREVTGVDAAPLLVHRTHMPAWDRSWSAMDRLRLPSGLHVCAAYSDRPGIGGRLEEALRVAARLTR